MKLSHGLIEGLPISSADKFLQESLRLPVEQARKRAKELFEEYPSSAYMTEIVSWSEKWGIVQFEIKRLCEPIDVSDEF